MANGDINALTLELSRTIDEFETGLKNQDLLHRVLYIHAINYYSIGAMPTAEYQIRTQELTANHYIKQLRNIEQGLEKIRRNIADLLGGNKL